MLYIDVKYLSIVCNKLSKFKQKSVNTWNFRCPFCNDSQKNEEKARGNIYPTGDRLAYKCFNCDISASMGTFIKHVDPALHNNYILEKLQSNSMSVTHSNQPIFKKEEIEDSPELIDGVLDNLSLVTNLPDDHKAVKYLNARQLPRDKWKYFYYTEAYKQWYNSIVPDKFATLSIDTDRLIMPYFNNHGKVVAVAARAFDDSKPKYFLNKFDEDAALIYGMDRINNSKKIYIVEGQIDSLFLPNCIAVSGSGFGKRFITSIKENSVVIFDREPRNKDIVKLIKESIKAGFHVCLLPDNGCKDINDLILNGWSIEKIIKEINDHTYVGIAAKLQFEQWRRI